MTLSFTPLHTAAAAGKAQAVEELLKRGADVTANNQNNQTPLFMAAESGNLSTIRAISGRLQLQDRLFLIFKFSLLDLDSITNIN